MPRSRPRKHPLTTKSVSRSDYQLELYHHLHTTLIHSRARQPSLRSLVKIQWAQVVSFESAPTGGETLCVKDVFPDVRLIHFCEWFYGQPGADIDFDQEFPTSFDTKATLRTWNALHLQNFENCDAAVTPTQWQWQQHSLAYREGIDTENLGPNPKAMLKTPSGQVLRAGDPVKTYVVRNLEPYRGFHVFMRALEKIQREHKYCHAVIVGGDDVSYSGKPKAARNWREQMLGEVRLDPARTHFMGKVPYQTYKTVLQVSMTHIYLTYPFVLSWSILEAQASGCLIVGSNTPPVKEVIKPFLTGLLSEFLDSQQIALTTLDAMHDSKRCAEIKFNAMHTFQAKHSLSIGLDSYMQMLSA